MTYVSASDAWAVGGVWAGDRYNSLAEHWNGHSWKQAPTPPASGYEDGLLAISAPNRDDAWAVGNSLSEEFGTYVPLVEHWNGRRWSKVSLPPPFGQNQANLSGVTAIGPDDVWIVGGAARADCPGDAGALLDHWDGHEWTPVRHVRGADMSMMSLWAVTGFATDDVWAVGSGYDGMNVILHYDGKRWSTVDHPSGDHFINFLYGIAGSGPDDVWAVGGYSDGRPQPSVTQILHWDGRHWSHVKAPSPGHVLNNLYAVSADSPDDAWAVGYIENDGEHHLRLCLHWDGEHWLRATL